MKLFQPRLEQFPSPSSTEGATYVNTARLQVMINVLALHYLSFVLII